MAPRGIKLIYVLSHRSTPTHEESERPQMKITRLEVSELLL